MKNKRFDIDYHYFLDTILASTGYRVEIQHQSDDESVTCILTFYQGKSTENKFVCKQMVLKDRFQDLHDILERTTFMTLKYALSDFIKNNLK
jgi:hypothetical protein